MAWKTTKDGRHFNTDWIDDDNAKKERQIAENKKQADNLNSKYAEELSAKGYVGLSGEESDKFIEQHHNKQLIGSKTANTMEGAQSRRINAALRAGKMPDNEKDKKMVERLDKAISKNELPQDMTLFRGIPLSAFDKYGTFGNYKKLQVSMDDFKDKTGNIDFDAWGVAFEKAHATNVGNKLAMAKTLIGKTLEDDGYMTVSASSERNIFGFSDINMQVHAPKGTHAYISNYKEESEIILPRGTKLKVVDVAIGTYKAVNGNSEDIVQLIVELE